MKKIIPLCMVLILVGCSAKHYTPTIPAKFNTSAVYSMGDYSFTCDIKLDNGTVTVMPTSTRAAGLKMICDGVRVVYDRKGMGKSFDMPAVTYYNPSVVLYQIFASLPDAKVVRVDDHYQYTGTIGAGDYVLDQADDDSIISISVPSESINIKFDRK